MNNTVLDKLYRLIADVFVTLCDYDRQYEEIHEAQEQGEEVDTRCLLDLNIQYNMVKKELTDLCEVVDIPLNYVRSALFTCDLDPDRIAGYIKYKKYLDEDLKIKE